MSTLWDDISKTIREGVDTMVSKTEELTKIGKIKVDIINIKRNIEKQFAELGGTVYNLMEDKKTSITNNADVKKIVKKVKALEEQLKARNAELKKVKVKEDKNANAKVTKVKEVKQSDKSKETEPAA